jgi:hypothetical protein
MALIYSPKHFAPEELISPGIFALCGADALYMYDPNILRGADALRETFGPMIANTWHNKKLAAKYGYHRFRGLRARNQKIGAPKSAHKIGIKKTFYVETPGAVPYSAIDLWPTNISVKDLHDAIKTDISFWAGYFRRIETHKPNGQYITWFHGDSKLGNVPGKIKWFKP